MTLIIIPILINFKSLTLEQAEKFTKPFSIVTERVKPQRESQKIESAKKYWWRFHRQANGLIEVLSKNEKVFALPVTSKYLNITLQPSQQVFSNAIIVIGLNRFNKFSILQSNIHECWARYYSSSLESRMRYLNEDCFETFPFPQNASQIKEQQLETIGESYHEHRRKLMLGMQLGLTKTYNLFHSNAIRAQAVSDKDKQVAALQKHLEKTPNTISFNEAIQGIFKLRELHVQMDEAVLDAYGWNDIALRHDFYEVDYLPENDRIRYTIHPDARKEVLKRLLELNHKIHEEEVKAGLWEKKKTSTKESTIVNEPNAAYGGDLFNQE